MTSTHHSHPLVPVIPGDLAGQELTPHVLKLANAAGARVNWQVIDQPLTTQGDDRGAGGAELRGGRRGGICVRVRRRVGATAPVGQEGG